MSSERAIGVGVIGLGGMGGRHARILAQRVKGAEVRAVFDPDTTRAEGFANLVDDVRITDDAESLIRDSAIDAVVIASPDVTHAPLTLACLAANKAVLCEKPLAQSAAEAWEVVQREAEIGKRLVQVGFMRRYDPAHLALKRAIDAGSVGSPRVMRGWHRNEISQADIVSERVVIGSLIHDIDSARWLMNDEIVSVRVVGQRVDEAVAPGEHDLLLAECTLASGRHALLEVFVNAHYGYEVGVEVVGSTGVAKTPGEQDALVKRARMAGVEVAPDWLVRFDAAYERQTVAWIAGLQTGQAVTGADAWAGYSSLMCADACIDSLRNGRDAEVKLPEPPTLYI
jgi:myo-inositol 2-dehydrogenase / D-chiro-inositol 1-dehydrogenase